MKCILAIVGGAAITHTLVPPTPGPLMMAANFEIDLREMSLVGALVATAAAIAGILFAGFADRRLEIPVREIEGQPESEPLTDDKLPRLFISLVPVLLPVVMIAAHTVTSAVSDAQLLSQSRTRLEASSTTLDDEIQRLTTDNPDSSRSDLLQVIRDETRDTSESVGVATSLRKSTAVLGDPNLALLFSAGIALMVYLRQRKPTKATMSKLVEASLMNAGLIILITAGGSAFGGMLKLAGVGNAIHTLFVGSNVDGVMMWVLSFPITALLKIVQGSGTAAMIVTS